MDDELMTDEDRDREYLRQHPAHELSLWKEWVLVVCNRRNMPPPTGREWDALTARWQHNKMPLESVDELEAMRKAPVEQGRVDVNVGGRWEHCSPELLNAGIDCAKTPRRPCECAHGGSHDHFISPNARLCGEEPQAER
jgi:hypothetical protein